MCSTVSRHDAAMEDGAGRGGAGAVATGDTKLRGEADRSGRGASGEAGIGAAAGEPHADRATVATRTASASTCGT